MSEIPEHLQRFDWYEPHQRWLRGEEGGVRAILRGCDLRNSDLRNSDLRYTDLRGCDLRNTDLRYSDLRGCDLRNTELRYSDLRGCDLRGCIGFHLLTQTDHGYMVYATYTNEWRIRAGCRDYSIATARKHWGSPDYHTPSSGSRIVALLDWLATQPVPEETK